MAKKYQGYVEWVAETPPPVGGYMIHSRLYYFLPNAEFDGRRIELIKAKNMEATVRNHSPYIKDVDLLDKDFQDEVFWARVKASGAQVYAYLQMHGLVPKKSEEMESKTTTVEAGKKDGKQSDPHK